MVFQKTSRLIHHISEAEISSAALYGLYCYLKITLLHKTVCWDHAEREKTFSRCGLLLLLLPPEKWLKHSLSCLWTYTVIFLYPSDASRGWQRIDQTKKHSVSVTWESKPMVRMTQQPSIKWTSSKSFENVLWIHVLFPVSTNTQFICRIILLKSQCDGRAQFCSLNK